MEVEITFIHCQCMKSPSVWRTMNRCLGWTMVTSSRRCWSFTVQWWCRLLRFSTIWRFTGDRIFGTATLENQHTCTSYIFQTNKSINSIIPHKQVNKNELLLNFFSNTIYLYFKIESVCLCAHLTLYPATDCAAATDISGVSGRWQLSSYSVRRSSR